MESIIALEHEERRAWIEQLMNISLVTVGLLALFAVFFPVAMQFSLQKDISEVKNVLKTLPPQIEELQKSHKKIEEIDYYRLQSSIMFIVAPHSLISETSVSENLIYLLKQAFLEVKSRIKRISQNGPIEGEIKDIIEITLRQLAINLRSLQSLEMFEKKSEIVLFKKLEDNIADIINNHSNGIKWDKTLTAIDPIVKMLESKLPQHK
ncbi:MAG: hypothetical protein AB1298_01390 [Bacteroidota bacterium]